MNRRHKLFVLLVLPLAFFFGVSDAQACTCGEATIAQQLENASTVFVGTVIKRVRSSAIEPHGIEVTFKVTKFWKGDVGREVAVYTGPTLDLYPSENLCAPTLKLGTRYLVFALGKEKLETDICSGTAAITNAKTTIQQLGIGKTIVTSPKSKARRQ